MAGNIYPHSITNCALRSVDLPDDLGVVTVFLHATDNSTWDTSKPRLLLTEFFFQIAPLTRKPGHGFLSLPKVAFLSFVPILSAIPCSRAPELACFPDEAFSCLEDIV